MSTKRKIRELRRAGYVVVVTHGNHLRVSIAGASGFVITGGTPSDHREGRNLTALLRKLERQGPGAA